MAGLPTRIARSPELPLDFDWRVYVNHATNRDLNGFNERQAAHHYAAFGRDEGRVGGEIDGRGAFLGLIAKDAALLEIGPFCTPSFTTATHRVRFLDAFPTKELRKIVAELPWGKPELVPEIDYVWQGGPYADMIAERFDAVFSSHNIEHQPCLVTYLRDIASVLRPGKRLFLIVPDRRFCFDYYLAESTIADVLDAFIEGRREHRACNILEHRLLLTHNEAAAHWDGEHGPDTRRRAADPEILERIKNNLRELPRRSAYIDTHAWHFVPDSFAYIIRMLKAAGLTSFDVERVYPTMRPTNEFFAVLRLSSVN